MAIVTALAMSLCACGGGGNGKAGQPLPKAPRTIRLSSPAFAAGARIPARFTCDGQNASPPLAWSGVPARARQLALSLDDPDAPGGDFTHWTLYGIDRRAGASPAGATPRGAVAGRNSFGRTGYSGPCPPKGAGPHRYRFVLYALSRPLGLGPGASPDDFRAAVSKAGTAAGVLTGTYSR